MKPPILKSLVPVIGIAFSMASLHAQTWTQTSGGPFNWGDSANWSPANVPNSNAATANLTADISGDLAITLNQDITVKNLIIGDPSPIPKNNFTIIQGGVFTLNLSANTGTPTIAQNFGDNTISVPVSFSGASGTINNNAAGTTLVFTDSVSSNGSLIKGGTGDVVFAGDLTVASGLVAGSIGLQVSSGLLQLTNPGSTADMTNHKVLVATGASDATLQVHSDLANASGIDIGAGTGTATLDVDAGAIVDVDGQFRLGFGLGAIAVANINDGQITADSVILAPGSGSNGTLNISANGTVTANSIAWTNLALTSAAINLNGGILNTSSVGSGAGGGSDTLSFDGGTLNLSAPSGNQTLGVETVGIKDGGATIMVTSNATTLAINTALTANGTGGLTKSGEGTLILNAASTYTGDTLVSEGTLKNGINNAIGTAGKLTVKSVYDLNGFNQEVAALDGGNTTTGVVQTSTGTPTLTINNLVSGSYGGGIAGDINIVKNGLATQTLSGTNTFTGTTTILAGKLVIGSNGATGNLGAGGVSNDGILAFNRSNAYSVSNAISGSGSVEQTGQGTTILNGNNTYSGGTTITGGTLQIGEDSKLGDSSGNLTFNGGALGVTSGLSLDRAIILAAGGGTLSQGSNAVQINGAISGSGNLSKTGAGTLTFNGSGTNTANGTLTVEAGTVNAAAANVFGPDQKVFLLQGTTLDLAGHNQTVGGLIGNGNALLGNGNLTLNLADNRAFSGVISGNGALIKTGTGTQQISNESSTYFGGTQVLGGTLVVPSDAALGTASGGLVLDAGTLKLASASTSFTTARSLALGNSGGTLDTTGRTATLNGGISGNGSLTKNGTGTLVLAGSNSYAGGTTVNLGTLAINSDARLGSGGATLNGGVLSVTSTTGSARDFVLCGGSLSQVQYVTHTISGNISGAGALKKEGLGTLTLSGNNTYQGGTQISQGVLSVASDAHLGNAAGAVALGNATLQSTGTFSTARGLTLGSPSSSVSIASGQVLTWNGTVSGSGALSKTGLGELALTGNNTYAGATYIEQGTLTISSQENLGTAVSSVSFQNGSLKTGAAMSFTRGLVGSTGTVNTGGFDSTFSGVVSVYNFTKTGNGTLTLSNTGNSPAYLNVAGGTLRAAAAGALNTNSFGGVSVSGGAIYDLDGFNTSIGALDGSGAVTLGNATLTLNNGGSFGGTISGNGSIIKNGGSYQSLSGANSYAGGTTVNSGGLVFNQASSLPAAGQITVNSGGYAGAGYALDQAFLDKFNKAGSGGVIGFNANSSNTLDLTGFNASATLGSNYFFANFSGSLNPQGSSFRFGGGYGQLTVSGNLTGSRSLANTGALTLLLSGTNSYNGGTSAANSAVVIFTNASAIPASGSLTAASGGYIGNSFNVNQAFLDKFDKANSAGIIGVNTNTSSSLDLTGFHAEASLGTTGMANIHGTITPQANQYRFAGGGGSLMVGSTLDGGRSVFVSDLNVTLIGTNTYNGGTQIASGASLSAANDYNLGDASGGISLAGSLIATGSFTMTRALSTNEGTINVQASTLNANGAISGTNLYKTGSGVLGLGATNSFNGLDIQGGNVNLGLSGALSSGVTLNIENSGSNLNLNGFSQSISSVYTSFGTAIHLNGATLTVDSESYNAIYGDIAGSGSLVKSGNGTLYLSAGKTYGGSTTLNAGTLYLENGSSLGMGADAFAFNGGTLGTGNSFAFNRSITFSGVAAKSIEVTDYDPFDEFDTVVTLSGSLSGSGNFTKSGAGVLQLSGSSSHNGSISVVEGELKVTGSTSSTVIASSSDTVVSGTGSVGSLLISNGATLAPGNSPGTLTAGSATFGADGSYDWEIQSNSIHDVFNVTGALSITATAVDPFVIHVFTLDGSGDPGLMSGFNTASNASWTLVNANSISGFAANKFSVDLVGFSNFYDGTFAVATNGSNDLVLNYTAPTAPVPEPGTWALLLLGGSSIVLISRRKTNRSNHGRPGDPSLPR